MINSKKFLFNSKANFFVIIELTATTPPNALTGSQDKAFLKDTIWFFSSETPVGFVCFIITVPFSFLRVCNIKSAE